VIEVLDRLAGMGAYWRKLKLAHRFAIAGGLFTLVAMALCGLLTTTFVTDNVIQQRGSATALFMDRGIAPLLRGLGDDGVLSPTEQSGLDELTGNPAFKARFPYLDVWLHDGTIAYSNSRAVVAHRFALPRAAAEAFTGQVVVTFSDLGAAEHVARGFRSDFVEIYSPVRLSAGGPVIAVAEIHESTAPLEEVLFDVTIMSWASVGITAIVVMAGLFGIVLEGSRTIERQRQALAKRLQHSNALNERYLGLKEQAQRASRNVTELTDQHLRTIGADLHDGPAQMIGFAALKVEQVRQSRAEAEREQALQAIETSLASALDDIRDISRGLVLPSIESLTLGEVVDHAVELHAHRTGIEIGLDNGLGPVRSVFAVSICVFRFVQEGLNNAFRHGLAEDQKVVARLEDGVLHLVVTNWNRVPVKGEKPVKPGIGLQGLRARVQSIGGQVSFRSEEGQTRLEMSLDLKEGAFHD
jgi:signal transduction histidine kinase